jgi:hypothetical protein
MAILKKIIKLFNHEAWRTCGNCGLDYDARLSDVCDSCGFKNEI